MHRPPFSCKAPFVQHSRSGWTLDVGQRQQDKEVNFSFLFSSGGKPCFPPSLSRPVLLLDPLPSRTLAKTSINVKQPRTLEGFSHFQLRQKLFTLPFASTGPQRPVFAFFTESKKSLRITSTIVPQLKGS